MRKHLLASLITLIGLAGLNGQDPVHVYGTVYGVNGGGQDSVNILVSVFYADSTFCQSSTFTGPDGTYDVTMSCTPSDTNVLGFVQVNMIDCNNMLQTQFYTAFNQVVEFEANFNYCQNNPPDSCIVIILEQPNPGALNYLTAWTPASQSATYLWSTGDSTQNIYPVESGTYCVTATLSPLGCSVTDCYDYVIDTSGACFAFIVSTPLGNNIYDLEAVGTGVPPYLYSWSTGATSQFLQGVDTGYYCVVVTDALGCAFTTCIIVPDNNLCQATIVPDGNGGLTAIGQGFPPVSYLWSTGDSSETIYPQVMGLYCVTITDANGCQASDCYDYWFQSDSCVAFVTAFLEDSSTLALQAIYSGFGLSWTYLWSTGEVTEDIYPQDPSQTYCVTITDNTGCTATGCYDPTNWCYVWLDLQYIDTASAVITANVDPIFNWPGSPPPTYLWSTGDTGSSLNTDSSGTYCVTVSFSSGCSATACTQVDFENVGTNCSSWVWQYQDSTNTWNTEVFAWGAGNFSYQWSTGDTTNIIQLDPPNQYACVTVTSSLGCQSVACVDSIYNPCQPVITEYMNNGYDVLAASSNLDPSQNPSFLWSNGEAGTVITVTEEGTYCVTVEGGGCTGTACIDVVFNAGCGVTIAVADTIQGTLFTAQAWGTPPFTYLWDNGSTDSYLIIDFGLLDHCVTVTDANGCVSSACTYIDSCSAYIYLTYSPDPNLHVAANLPISFCQWNTGNPGDTMLWLSITQPGTYCATITSILGCSSTACITIDSLFPAQGSNVITGYVLYSDSLASVNGQVHAYSMANNHGGTFEEKASVQIGQGGYYSISGLDPGVYLVKADFADGSSAALNYIPTYHQSKTTWEAADPVTLPNSLNVTTDIELVHKTSHTGSGVIGGVVTDPNHIVADVNEDTRNLVGLSHVEILLNDLYGQPLDYIISDENGNFKFTDLAFGTYRLRYDIPGLPSPDVWVTLTADNPEKLQVTIIAENGSSAVHDLASEVIQLYPNPAREQINVVVPGNNSIYDIQVVDMQGRIVYAGSARNYNGILSIDVSQYSNGLYHVNLINDNHRFHGRFIKQE